MFAGNANSGTRIRDQGAVGLPPSSQMSAGSNMSVCGSDPVVTGKKIFTPQPLMAVGVLFSPMVSGWLGGRASGRAGDWAGGEK